MLQRMQPKMWRRHYKAVTATVVLVAVLGASIYSGFLIDIGMAALSRLPQPSFGLHGAAPYDPGPVSLEERILEADVIVRGKLRSVSQGVETITYSGEEDGEWINGKVHANSLQFEFVVLEYLKGDGGDAVIAIVTDETVPYNTKLGALAFGQGLSEVHDTAWDDREAILFLSGDPSILSAERPDRYWLGWISVHGGQIQEDAYTVISRNKKWLPAASTLQGGGATRSDSALFDRDRHFLTGAIPTEEGGTIDLVAQKTAKRDYNMALGAGSDSSTITLARLKDLIAKLEEELAAGDSSPEYSECVYEKYKWEREFHYNYFKWNGEFRQMPTNHELVSGMPAATAFSWHNHSDPDPRLLVDDPNAKPTSEYWLEGEDASLFQLGNLPIISNARPLPEGKYQYYLNSRKAKYIPCNAYPEARRTWNIHTVEVSAPAGVLREAFFDPVDIGGAVGSDSENGVLQPDWFQTDGGKSAIERIAWRDGQVEMTLSPPTDLDDHRLDFIALDGSVSLRLAFNDAVELADADGISTLAWSVCEQPWQSGDLLMLRIAEGIPNDSVQATNNAECLAETQEDATGLQAPADNPRQ